ncbi:MAG: hypothetical protein ABIB43_05995 [archaeon]
MVHRELKNQIYYYTDFFYHSVKDRFTSADISGFSDRAPTVLFTSQLSEKEEKSLDHYINTDESELSTEELMRRNRLTNKLNKGCVGTAFGSKYKRGQIWLNEHIIKNDIPYTVLSHEIMHLVRVAFLDSEYDIAKKTVKGLASHELVAVMEQVVRPQICKTEWTQAAEKENQWLEKSDSELYEHLIENWNKEDSIRPYFLSELTIRANKKELESDWTDVVMLPLEKIADKYIKPIHDEIEFFVSKKL